MRHVPVLKRDSSRFLIAIGEGRGEQQGYMVIVQDGAIVFRSEPMIAAAFVKDAYWYDLSPQEFAMLDKLVNP